MQRLQAFAPVMAAPGSLAVNRDQIGAVRAKGMQIQSSKHRQTGSESIRFDPDAKPTLAWNAEMKLRDLRRKSR